MTIVNTVLGPVSGDSLGITLMHEHFCTRFAGWQCDALALPYDRREAAAVCAPLLEEAKGFGLRTVVDATANDLGRDVELQKEIAERSGVNIIAATGMYEDSQAPCGDRGQGIMRAVLTMCCQGVVHACARTV